MRRCLPDALWVNLLQPDVYRALGARPERLRELVEFLLELRPGRELTPE